MDMDLARMKRGQLLALCRERGLAARGSKDDLAASLAGAFSAAASAAAATERMLQAVVGKGCLKRSEDGSSGGSSGAARKVTFSLVAKEDEAGEAPVAAKVEAAGAFADGNITEVCADAQVMRPSTNTASLHAVSGIECLNHLADDAEEEREVVGATVDWKCRTRGNSKRIAATAQAGVSHRSTRKSSSFTAADSRLQSRNDPAEEEGEVLGEAGHTKLNWKTTGKLKVGETLPAAAVSGTGRRHKCTATASPAIMETKRSQRKEEHCKLAVQKSEKLAVSGRVTRSCSINAAVVLPVVIENRRKMKTETVQLGRMAPAVSKSDVPRNEAPITRSLRIRALQNNNTAPEETHVGKKLEKKRQPSGTAIGRHQQVASSVEEEEQAAAPCKSSPLLENVRGEEIPNGKGADDQKQQLVRRSTRNHVVSGRT